MAPPWHLPIERLHGCQTCGCHPVAQTYVAVVPHAKLCMGRHWCGHVYQHQQHVKLRYATADDWQAVMFWCRSRFLHVCQGGSWLRPNRWCYQQASPACFSAIEWRKPLDSEPLAFSMPVRLKQAMCRPVSLLSSCKLSYDSYSCLSYTMLLLIHVLLSAQQLSANCIKCGTCMYCYGWTHCSLLMAANT